MKKPRLLFRLALAGFLFAAAGAPAVVFTNNTAIGPFDTRYDGSDIVISNCTVLVGGAHSFASVQVGPGGTLTHSFWPNGPIVTTFTVADEPQVLFGTSPATLLNTNIVTPLVVTDISQTTTYSNGVDYVQTSLPDGTTQIQRTDTSAIPDGATVLVSYSWDDVTPAGLNLTVTGEVAVVSGGSINANGIGYNAGFGAGSGFSSGGAFYDGSGAGHGGSGGNSSNNAPGGVCYDSLYQPATLGSGGGASYAGNGGNGGGLVRIIAGGNVAIDGVITVNGADAANSRAGGGAGGGIWISAASVSGSGSITANGGAGAPIYGGGGGGGRIAIQCGTNNFSGGMAAYGGGGSQVGGAGTIFTQLSGQNGLLLVDNSGRAGANSTVTLPTSADVVISGSAGVVPANSFYPSNLTIGANSLLTGPLPGPGPGSLVVSVAGNLTVQSGGMLSVDGLGYAAGNGVGAGHTYFSGGYNFCGGGGHGGYGGAASITNGTGGTTYGLQLSPTTLGSGGGGSSESSFGGTGGGSLQLTVAGNLQVDGRITANGGNGTGVAGGGGSGGSIYIGSVTFAGSGSITANGGNGVDSFSGGGGGGRIAIITGPDFFVGNITASGGGGANWGGAGTIFCWQRTVFGFTSELILDNAGHSGASTPLQSAGSANLLVQNGAVGTASSSVAFASLLVSSNAWLTALTPYSSESFNISGNATFQAGGGFMADSGGYGSGLGSGPGKYTASFPYACSGGGHGGTGGSSASNSVTGGSANDYANSPSSSYPAGGGGGFAPYSTGGNGGGFVQMTINGTLQLDGLITANGGNGSGLGGGGGAGGGVNLSVGTFSGGGAITANGGNGVDSLGGGGGGGRIAVAFNNNSFTGALSAYGGGGANYGGAGTIYFRTNSTGRSLLIVDNGGHAGADSSIQSASSPTTDLTLRDNGLIYASGSFSFGNLVISSNAWLAVTNMSAIISANNVTLQPGSGIIADAGGYAANQGTGHGNYSYNQGFYPGSGGGHGGYGANSISNSAVGGAAYDSITQPSAPGSGGGAYVPYSAGGSGGGLIQMLITSTLRVDGVLSANGGNGSGNGGGGGSGGSLILTAGTLSGTGSISANGGNGLDAIGGGGGGGMIAVNFTSNLFAGTLSAYSGGGANYGGAGTIYLRTNSTGQSLLIVDNAGHRGTNTPVSSLPNSNLLLRNGAAAVEASSLNLVSLLITSNAWLVANTLPGYNSPGIINLSVSGNATIQAGGGIVADAVGSAQNAGTGHGYNYGGSPWYPCSGAGHGGYGAFGLSNLVAGGTTFDSTVQPQSMGSGGGGYSSFSVGGAGGGYINLQAGKGTLQLDGLISANGGNGSGSGGGGGSGGSIYLSVNSLAGTGAVTANGGNGADAIGGGGGGGRIAINVVNVPSFPPRTNDFTGTVAAHGGGGASYGGAGTIYYKTNSQTYGLVVLDNANHAGTNTSFDFINMDVTVQNQAVGLLPATGSWSPHNVLIRSNGVMTTLASGGKTVTVNANNLTIEAGGALSLDGTGYGPQNGPGAGSGSPSPNPRGGAGHGGYGGGNLAGGGAYDLIQTPINAGSGGASYVSGPPYSYGGAGGGALQLGANTLTVNGKLSANGANGGFNSGGGAGGSLYLLGNNLAGNGIISANGGPATGAAGGGGGGRVAIYCTASNNFIGQLSASGGNGTYPGGAGTIYTSVSGVGTLLVDNGGIAGTNTPLADSFSLPAPPFNLNISGAATVVPLTPLPLLSNLTISSGSTLTMPVAQSNLVIAVLNNATVAGSLNVDHLGYAQTNGPGAGSAIASKGSGGGYGGIGGPSSTGAPGGTNYGSATQPVDFGSGGGNGAATVTGGSEGAGALRLSVAGALNVDGNVSANGNPGWQDDSGGGAGGSVWISAGTLSGSGNIFAMGGSGAPLGGGGGGGGRIAIYTPTNNFIGTTNASGGSGASPGQPGTIFLSSAFAGFQIVSQSPTGLVLNTVSYVDLNFSEALDPTSVSASDFTLVTPAGVLAQTNLSAAVSGLSTVRVSFPAQNLLGNYSLQAATAISNIFGLPLGQAYTGTFAISLPAISGTVTDTNGAPVAGVLLQPDGGLTGVTTDTNGNYALGVPPGWNGTVTPALGDFIFVPTALVYTNVTGTLTGQNYLMVSTIAPNLAAGLSGTNFSMSWAGLPGVTYQIWSSTNLVDWQPLGDALAGTNGPMQILVPLGSDPAAFFRVGATQ